MTNLTYSTILLTKVDQQPPVHANSFNALVLQAMNFVSLKSQCFPRFPQGNVPRDESLSVNYLLSYFGRRHYVFSRLFQSSNKE